ncbi:hemerythrin domain-containing protein [Catellatospora sp. KI3]|uniref:hemerythrin domain-containing protein n=1 Tax=Catellatospora sp. KI3 TaxID=3041620 RepID=UPI0024830D28|nr:hemerythrin domain-containing protein [Catellatospora sp. KI3]MDI1466094.1 hemerythrin domain-containing protein [Catellatospora sp. KI3]
MAQSTTAGTGKKQSATGTARKSTTAAARSTATSKASASAKKSVSGATSTGMDAIALLKADHKVVEGLFKQFEKAGDNAHATKRKIVDQVIKELTTHAYIEESIFYPTARKAAPDTGEHVLESVEEHHVVAWMLSELRGMDPADERFDAKMAVLMENVRHHVEEEEKEWFPQVRKAIGRAELRELADRMEAAKADAPADPLSLSSASA